MSSDDHPGALTPDMLQTHVRLVDVADLEDWSDSPYTGDVGAAHTHLGAFGQLQLPVVSGGAVVYGQEFVAAERVDGQYGGRMAVLDLTDLDWPREKIIAAVLGLDRLKALQAVDAEQLLGLLQEVRKADEAWLAGAGYDPDDMDAIYEQLQRDQEALNAMAGEAGGLADGVDADDVPDSAPAITQPGDVWIIGPHRVACGDASSAADVAKLVGGARCDALVTDPPYGMNLDTDYLAMQDRGLHAAKGRTYRPVIGDDRPFDARSAAVPEGIAEQFWWGADWYRDTVPEGGSWVVWDKRAEYNDSVIGSMFELCWSKQRHQRVILRHEWTAYQKQASGEGALHPTQKPVAVIADILDRWTTPAGTVLDLYAGSGTTLVAAQQTSRAAFLLDIDARYVDVICKRAQLATGIKPVLESTGEAHDFTEGDV